MDMTRRSLLFCPLAATCAVKSGEMRQGETTITIIPSADSGVLKDGFEIAVRSSLKGATDALIEVFYEQKLANDLTVLLHQRALAPVVEIGGGMGDQMFTVPIESVKFIRVKLFTELARREFGR